MDLEVDLEVRCHEVLREAVDSHVRMSDVMDLVERLETVAYVLDHYWVQEQSGSFEVMRKVFYKHDQAMEASLEKDARAMGTLMGKQLLGPIMEGAVEDRKDLFIAVQTAYDSVNLERTYRAFAAFRD